MRFATSIDESLREDHPLPTHKSKLAVLVRAARGQVHGWAERVGSEGSSAAARDSKIAHTFGKRIRHRMRGSLGEGHEAAILGVALPPSLRNTHAQSKSIQLQMQ